MSVRFPYRVGTFYAGTGDALRGQLTECFLHTLGPGALPQVDEAGPRHLVALVAPHAGYIYSGPIAATGYAYAAADGRPNVVVVIGPNHTGLGSGISIMTAGKWRTPLGDIEVDVDLAVAIQKAARYIDIDEGGHRFEHAIEVQLPFLQYVYGGSVKLVPVSMLMQDLTVSRDVGEAVGRTCQGANALVVASTDLTHYESHARAARQDRFALEAITGLDEERLYDAVERHRITMCGYGPVAAAIVAAKRLGARRGELLRYATSGETSGDRSHVVGYATVALTR